MTLRHVTNEAIAEARLHQKQLELRLNLLAVGIAAFDTVLESLPETGLATLWLMDAIELAERVKGSING